MASKSVHSSSNNTIHTTSSSNFTSSQEATKNNMHSQEEQLNLQEETPLVNTSLQETQKFDIYQFNQKFEEYKKTLKNNEGLKEQKKLAELNKAPPPKKIYEYNIYELLLGMKDTWFDIIDDILALNFSTDIITQGNRMFFIGLTFITIGIILYAYYLFMHSPEDEGYEKIAENTKIIHIYHVNDDKKSVKNIDVNELISKA